MRSFIAAAIFLVAIHCMTAFQSTLTSKTRTFSRLSMNNDQLALLEKKLLERKAAANEQAVEVKSAAPATTTTNKKTVIVSQPKKDTSTITAKVASTAQQKTVIINPTDVKSKVSTATSTVVTPQQKPVASAATVTTTPASLSTGDFVAGVGLGLLPYLLIPAILLNAVKGFLGTLKKPKPLPVVQAPPVKAKSAPYTKSLGEGAKEGLSELLSGKKTEELELTRKAFKLSAAAFGMSAVLGAVIFTAGSGESTPAVPEKVSYIKT